MLFLIFNKYLIFRIKKKKIELYLQWLVISLAIIEALKKLINLCLRLSRIFLFSQLLILLLIYFIHYCYQKKKKNQVK